MPEDAASVDAPVERDPSVLYVFANRSLGMSSGKLSAQTGHAFVISYALSRSDVADHWFEHSQAMVVLEAQDAEELQLIGSRLKDAGLLTFPIIDEGRTELEPGQLTALGVEIVDKTAPGMRALFRRYPLWRD
jgi:PTH2 family peptidyl-tRNA hydrolase